MNRYMFGIHELTIDAELESRIEAAARAGSLVELAEKLAATPGSHVLARLNGNAGGLAAARSRHLGDLNKVFGRAALRDGVLAEISRVAADPHAPASAPPPDAVAGASEIDDDDPCWWWICEPDMDDPDWCYWEEYCDYDGNPLPEPECWEFGPDGEMYEVECLGEGFPCC
jgi:hypothetical protein